MKRPLILSLLLCLSILACARSDRDTFDGYVEGDFVYVASPYSGQLLTLTTKKGDTVSIHSPLFALDSTLERSTYEEANRRYLQAQANYDDLLKGKRPSEIESLKAQLQQAQATLELSEKTLQRNRKLIDSNVISQQDFDQVSSQRNRDYQRVIQLRSDLETAKLGAREDQRKAAEQEIQTRKAELDKASWTLAQKSQSAPLDALVFDTLFREGEFVPAGRPVVSLLPAKNIKVRTFLPEATLSSIRVGQRVSVLRDSSALPIDGTISFISSEAEFTPPIIYSRESRAKLVFLVEIIFAEDLAKQLHPGEPVQVQIR